MDNSITSSRRVAKNTLFLYFRMFLNMGVGLYTSRMVLDVLGVVDYGIYGLVGGIVTMFSFLNTAMSSATQRYLTFDIGKGDEVRLQQTFNASVNIHLLIGVVIVLFAETVGLWLVNAKLDIPQERMVAANLVYQFSILAYFFNVSQVPYNALIIARERMNIYAYISILETILKLGAVFILIYFNSDKLIIYGILIFVVSFIIRMLYRIYCKRKFKESVYKFYYEKEYYKELLNYSWWNLFGNIAAIARGQGSNILLNIFFGPIANAAYSLTQTVQGMIRQFVTNFQVAINPQITKNYASGNIKASMNLMFKSSKYSFFAMLLLIVPFLFNIEYVLNLWLKEVPQYAIDFMRIAFIYTLIETLSNPLMIGLQATGKIKAYQAVVGTLIFLNFPIVWLVLKYTGIPQYTYLVFCIISVISLIFRLYFLKLYMDLKIENYVRETIVPIVLVSFVTLIVIYFVPFKISLINRFIAFGIESLIIVTFLSVLILVVGLTTSERMFIKSNTIDKIFRPK